MSITKFFILFCAFGILSDVYTQTSEYGNLKIYSREPYLSSFGYYSGSHRMPSNFSPSRLDYNGISYTTLYDISNIGNFVINNNSEVRITLDGIFRIGAALAKSNFQNDNGLFPNSSITYYQLNLDFFTLSINPEYTFIFKHGFAVTAHFGIDLINIGGSVSLLEKGNTLKHSVGQFNLVPLAFRPAAYVDLGNSGIGIGAYINPSNILSFRYTSEELYSDDKWGFKTFDDFFKRYEFQIIFTF
uniref:Uncharacterized protein n=1 Tax=Ignavibacterium album TaxID=591197 RepID=A0A7V2ZL29_9BACT